MAWQQLQVKTEQQQVEALSDWLSLLGAQAVTLSDAQGQALLEPAPGAVPLWEQAWVCGLFGADDYIPEVLHLLTQQFGPLDYRLEGLADQDWLQAGRNNFTSTCFGGRLWVYPSWEPQPSGAAVQLDPGLAFGTGNHATTALCLEWLAGQVLEGKQIIDYGCGSGILAIAALKLGAKRVWAVDYDSQALTAAMENAKRNQAAAMVETLLPEQLPMLQVDVLLANILANPLIELASRFASLVAAEGQLVLSGILPEQSEQVQQAYQPWFKDWARAESEGWVRLTAIRQ